MSQRIVRRAGIAGIMVAGLLVTGSGVASATQLPVPASGSTPISIITAPYPVCNPLSVSYDWCCPRRYKPGTAKRPPSINFCAASRDMTTALG
ncbi:MAG: hypothetical protein ACRDSI_11120 [Pseudonocardiaceae bacterium]